MQTLWYNIPMKCENGVKMKNFLEISGGRKNQREAVEKKAVAILEKHFSRFRNLQINIELTNEHHEWGFCSWVNTGIKDREFEITLNKDVELVDLLETLAHEMVHVRQFARGETKHYVDGRIIWKGEDHTNTSYKKQPWEIEAHELEKEWASA